MYLPLIALQHLSVVDGRKALKTIVDQRLLVENSHHQQNIFYVKK